jgi:acyl-CoA oxidase
MTDELASERSNPTFDVTALTHVLDGGKEKTERRHFLENIVLSDPVFRQEHHLARVPYFTRGHEKAKHFVWKMREHNLSEEDMWQLRYAVNDEIPIDLHIGMFRMTLQTQATEEQQKKWLTLADQFRIIGCYAQTELGHGSNVRGIETTAHYDRDHQQWVLNTPTLTSTKWWPGGLGKTATHAAVFARLITPDGVDRGVFPFLVQLRSLDDHMPLPGITVGDIGQKWAYASNDNGFLKLKDVRIPREQLLMRWARVDPDGTFTRPPHDKLACVPPPSRRLCRPRC